MSLRKLQEQVNNSETIVLSSEAQAALVHAVSAGPDRTMLIPAGEANDMRLQLEQGAWQRLGMIGVDRTPQEDEALPNEQVGWTTPGERRFARVTDTILAGALAVAVATTSAGVAFGFTFRDRIENYLSHRGQDRPAASSTDYANGPVGSASGLGSPASPTTIVIQHGTETTAGTEVSTQDTASPDTADTVISTTIPDTIPAAPGTPPASEVSLPSSTSATDRESTTSTTTRQSTTASSATTASTAPSTSPTTALSTTTTRPPQTTATTQPVTTITSAPPSSPRSTEELPVLTITLPPTTVTPTT